jgi:hypothetical protein
MSSHTTRGRRKPPPTAAQAILKPGQMSPLAYLLMRINDVCAPPEVRDALAIAAAPYCHPKAGTVAATGKKVAAAEAAAEAGDEWGGDLDYDGHRPQ